MEQAISQVVVLLNDLLWSQVLIVLLVGAGLYFTVRSRFLQIRLFKEMFVVLKEGRISVGNGLTPFQAFCIGMAARVGTGNITGIAIAIALGGPGAIFWMWVIAVIGAVSGFVESTLAQIYKIKDGEGFRGGPAYYMEKGLKKRWMGALFAVLITVSFGFVFNAVQSNTITVAFENSFGINRLTLGVLITAAFAAIMFGGVKRIAKASEYIVVVLAVIYIGVALVITLANITEVPAVLTLIVKSAFGFEQAAGGTLGAVIVNGVKRGLFSNEAGMGSAPNAAAAAVTSHPVKQGLIQALGVLIDTCVICTSSAFIILLAPVYKQTELSGIELTQASLAAHMGSWAPGFLAVMILLFAFSTLIGNYYYGETNIEFLNTSKTWLLLYRLGVLGMILFGAVAKVQLVWDLADLFMGLMVIVNVIAILLLSNVAFAALHDYMKQKKAGQNPAFYKDSISGAADLEGWPEADKQKKNVL